jgi:hypothetical protein
LVIAAPFTRRRHHVPRHDERREQPAQEFEAANHRAAVRLLGKITRVDCRLVVGGAHGFTLFPNELSKSATTRMNVFLNRVLG